MKSSSKFVLLARKTIFVFLLVLACVIMFTGCSSGTKETHYCGVCGDVATMVGTDGYSDGHWYRCAECYRKGDYPKTNIIGSPIKWSRCR